MTRQCPVDQEDLAALTRVEGEAHACEACGGLWLTPEAMRSLGARLPKGATPTSVRKARSCSGCATAMGRLVIGETVIDVGSAVVDVVDLAASILSIFD